MCWIGIGAAHSVTLEGTSPIQGALAGGAGLALGIFWTFEASGGHLNPTVTIAHFVQGKMGTSLLDNILGLFVYLAAQVLGMFLAAAFSYGVYYGGDQSLLPQNGANITAADLEKMVCLYATCPTSTYSNSMASMFFDQVAGGAVMGTTVLAVTDPFNANPAGKAGMAPLIIGTAAGTMGLSYGSNAG